MTSEQGSAFGRHWGRPLFIVLIATVVLAGVPASASGPFPDRIPISGTPSGIAVDKPGNVFVSVRDGGRGLIWKCTREGVPTLLADLGQADIYGLIVKANGDLYAAMAVGPDRGVYRLDRDGTIEKIPGSGQIFLPNGFAFDDRGNLYVTESLSLGAGGFGRGGIWRIAPGGEAELWVRDDLLTGVGLLGNPPLGANGIAYDHGSLFVTNTDKHLVLRVPIEHDGSAGDVELWKTLVEVADSPLAGTPFPIMPDGLGIDVFGNLYLTVLTRNAIVRLDADTREQSTVAVLGSTGQAPSALLDTPASLVFGTGGGDQQNLFVTNLGWMVKFVPSVPWPGPSLVKVAAGTPGRPIH